MTQFIWVQYYLVFLMDELHISKSEIHTMLRLFPMISITWNKFKTSIIAELSVQLFQEIIQEPDSSVFFPDLLCMAFVLMVSRWLLYFQVAFLFSRQKKGRMKGEG